MLPGSRLPADGEVVTGHSFVDEAMLTGESAPVAKSPGDHVISGTINQVRCVVIIAVCFPQASCRTCLRPSSRVMCVIGICQLM